MLLEGERSRRLWPNRHHRSPRLKAERILRVGTARRVLQRLR